MESDLRVLLHAHLREFARAQGYELFTPNSDKLKQFLENERDPGTHLISSVLPTEPNPLTVCDGGAIFKWIYQILINIRDGLGDVPAQRIADQLASHFPYLTQFVGGCGTYRIISRAMQIPAITGKGWHSVPVQIRVQLIH